MSDDLRTRLEAAAAAGEIISVVYHRGSQPGTVREIAPMETLDGNKVRARDMATNEVKVFNIDFLEEAPLNSASPYDPEYQKKRRESAPSINEAVSPYVPELQALGWHVELDETSVCLFRFLKNGKPRKSYAARMGFEEWITDHFINEDGTEQVTTRPSKRPYSVSVVEKKQATQTFVYIDGALALFLQEARRLDATA
jgi:hypothetical protein